MSEAEEQKRHGFLELVDMANNQTIGTRPIKGLMHLPRVGESILLPLGGEHSWARYTVRALEYFLGYPDDTVSEGGSSYFKIVLYAERER